MLPPQNTMRSRIPGGFDMNVNILTSGYWPSYPIIDAKMPAELNDYQQARSGFRAQAPPKGALSSALETGPASPPSAALAGHGFLVFGV